MSLKSGPTASRHARYAAKSKRKLSRRMEFVRVPSARFHFERLLRIILWRIESTNELA